MARYTIPYCEFLIRLREVEILRQSAAKKERKDAVGMRDEINALCRGSIVLLSSHVEAYIKEVGETALDAIYQRGVCRTSLPLNTFYHISKDLIDEIKMTTEQTHLAEKIFNFIESDLVHWSQTGPFSSPVSSERFNKGFSNPKFEKVKSYFNRFGYTNYRVDFYRRLQADAKLTENMLDHLVDIRNSIAHGDQSATKTPTDLKIMMFTVSRFCRVMSCCRFDGHPVKLIPPYARTQQG